MRSRTPPKGCTRREPNPIIALMAEQGIAALARALPALHADARDRSARHDALYGAWLCGATLGHVAMGLHHKLCHTLGGSFNLPHAETHTSGAAARVGLQRSRRAAGDGDHRAGDGGRRCWRSASRGACHPSRSPRD